MYVGFHLVVRVDPFVVRESISPVSDVTTYSYVSILGSGFHAYPEASTAPLPFAAYH